MTKKIIKAFLTILATPIVVVGGFVFLPVLLRNILLEEGNVDLDALAWMAEIGWLLILLSILLASLFYKVGSL